MSNKATLTPVLRIRSANATAATDRVAVERPLQIKVRLGDFVRDVTLTMRTPGDDGALAVGFLFAERVITEAHAVAALDAIDEDTVMVAIDTASCSVAEAALGATERRFVTTGACGVCGRTSIADLMPAAPVAGSVSSAPQVEAAFIHELPAQLRAAQQVFAETGGLHAAGLFTPEGALQAIFEDVGRHNAVDKLVGTMLLERRLPATGLVLVVSGRASFELVQKAAVAGIPVMVAVGAPSSLAVEVASEAGMTLIGFARERSFNVYTGAARVVGIGPARADETRIEAEADPERV
jgi:FdhD protein